MADRTLHSRRPMMGDVLVIAALGTAVIAGIVACEVVTFRAAAAQVGPELVVRACEADRPGICQTVTFPVCDREAAAAALANDGLVIRMAVCRAALVEV